MAADLSSSSGAQSYGILQSGKDGRMPGLSRFPAHVTKVKDGLLDFNYFVGIGASITCEVDEDDIPLSAFKSDGIKGSQLAWDREFVEEAQELAKGSQRLGGRLAPDSEWRSLFRKVVKSREDSMHYSGDMRSTIACAENEVWDTDLDPYLSSPTLPKPDLYFGFPVHIRDDRETASLRKDAFSQNCTVGILTQLATKGLRSVPVSRSLTDFTGKKAIDGTEREFPLPCFPWCIMQLKGVTKATEIDQSEEESLETSRQASISATGALAMLEKLARFADVKQDSQHIPPVISITSVGSNTTVWLAFSEIVDEKLRDHKMLSIWEGCISKIWDALQFCRIIDNLLFWAQHILRPQLSQYIDQWKLHYYPVVPNVYFHLEKDLETAELVHRIQDRLSSLNISPNSDLPGLIRQAVILQEVMKPKLEKEQPAAKDVPEPIAKDEMQGSKKVPFHPRVEPVAGGASGDAITNEVEQEECDSKKEEKPENRHEGKRGERDNEVDDKTCLSVLLDKVTLQSNPVEKKASVLVNLPVIDEKPSSGSSTTTEIEQSPPSTGPEPQGLTVFPSAARVQQILENTGPDSNPESPTDTNAEVTPDSKPPFSYSYEFKTSDFEFDQARSKNAGVISERRYIISKNGVWVVENFFTRVYHRRYHGRSPAVSQGASKKDPESVSESRTDPSSARPNPFTATSFKLTFEIKLCIPLVAPLSREEIQKMGSAIFRQSLAEFGSADSPPQIDRFPDRKRPKFAAPGEFTKPLLPRVKIPWKDKHIIVRLPPVMPAPQPESSRSRHYQC